MRADLTRAVAGGAEAVECRVDMLERQPTARELTELLTGVGVETIVTNRPTREGGRFEGPESQRLKTLAMAAEAGASFIDVELSTPPEQRPRGPTILSHHDLGGCPDDLDAIVAALEASGAAVNKVAFTAHGPEDALRTLDVLRACKKPTIASAMGEAGFLSRILAKKFGGFGVFASLDEGVGSAPGQATIREVRDLYRWDSIGPRTACYGVIGCPIAHSMSPAVHNAAFGAAGLDAVYVPLLIGAGSDNFNRFMDALLARPWLDWRGLSVTIPHKESALAYVGAANCDALACKIGAVNTITVGPGGRLRGDNTDYAAAIDSLCQAMGTAREGLARRRVAVLGAGGAARAVVAALAHLGADVTIYNRTVSRGKHLAEEFGCRAEDRNALAKLESEIVINCTPIGMHPREDESPLESIPPAVKVVFDTVYNPIRTRLLRQAEAAGCATVLGLEMFVNQAAAQFEIWTGTAAPRDVMRRVVVERLSRQ